MPDTNRIQVNVPLSEDEKKMIQEAAKQHGLSQAEFLRQAARNAVMDDLAEAVPEQGDAIAEFRAMQEKMMACYQQALEQAANAYSLASSKVKDDLETLGKTIRENQELRTRVEELESAYADARRSEQDAYDLIAETQKKDAELTELQQKNDELERKLLDAEKKLFEAEKQYANQLEAERKAHQDELIASIVRVVQQNK